MPIAMSKYAKTKKYDMPLFMHPESTQEIWPVKSIDDSGIFELNEKMYSKCFVLTDINFAGVTDDEQKSIIINFSRVLNSMSCRFSYTIANEYIDEASFDRRMLYKKVGGERDALIDAFNEVIKEKLTDARQGLYQTIYLTLTVIADNLQEAKTNLGSIEASLRSAFIQIGINGMAGSQILALDIDQRMQIWYNFTHFGLVNNYRFDMKRSVENGESWLDIVSPVTMEFHNDYFVMNGNYGKVLYVSEYPKTLESDIISELSKMNCMSYISVNNELLNLSALKSEINRKYTMVGLEIEREKQRNRNNNDFLSDANESVLGKRESLLSYQRAVESGDDHYFNTTMMIMYMTDSYEKLLDIDEKLASKANIKSSGLEVCFSKQREAINSTFMFGVQEFKRVCNFSAPCLAMFLPYKTQELNDAQGLYYGVNQLSQNPIIGSRKKLANYNGMFLGQSGSGKSMFCKQEIIGNYVNFPDDQIIIIDPMNEYKNLASIDEIKSTIISFDSQKEIYVNPMDVNFKDVGYAELQEIIGEKTDFLYDLLSSCMKRDIDAEEMGVLGEAVEKVYSENYAVRQRINGIGMEKSEYDIPEYMKTKVAGIALTSDLSEDDQVREFSPTLQDVYQMLKDMDTPVSNRLASHMLVFVNGALNLFNHRTNIDLASKFLVFELTGIKQNLRVTSMLVMLELIKSKAKENVKQGFWTHIYIDEFHELLGIDRVEQFVIKLWKEMRKLKGALTGITQNMTDLLEHSSSSTNLAAILSNTLYFALLSQSTIDRDMLMRFLPDISPAMFNYVEGAAPGTGLLKMGNVTVPFDMRMSKGCKIYQIVNTDGQSGNQAASI